MNKRQVPESGTQELESTVKRHQFKKNILTTVEHMHQLKVQWMEQLPLENQIAISLILEYTEKIKHEDGIDIENTPQGQILNTLLKGGIKDMSSVDPHLFLIKETDKSKYYSKNTADLRKEPSGLVRPTSELICQVRKQVNSEIAKKLFQIGRKSGVAVADQEILPDIIQERIEKLGLTHATVDSVVLNPCLWEKIKAGTIKPDVLQNRHRKNKLLAYRFRGRDVYPLRDAPDEEVLIGDLKDNFSLVFGQQIHFGFEARMDTNLAVACFVDVGVHIPNTEKLYVIKQHKVRVGLDQADCSG